MLTSPMTIADDSATDHVFDKVKQVGMTSSWVEQSTETKEGKIIEVKQEMTLGDITRQRKSIAQLQWKTEDADTGEFYFNGVHFVVNRHPTEPDANVITRCFMLGELLQDATFMAALLKGNS